MHEIMLLLPLVGRNVVEERSGKDIKNRDDDNTQILLRVILLKGWSKHLKQCKTNNKK